jgi:hypothetical protein
MSVLRIPRASAEVPQDLGPQESTAQELPHLKKTVPLHEVSPGSRVQLVQLETNKLGVEHRYSLDKIM